MKKTLFLLLILASSAGAIQIYYQDNTHLNSLCCCDYNGTCFILKDIDYFINGTIYKFNTKNMSNISSCFEVGNKIEIDVKNWSAGNLPLMALFIVVILIIIIVIFYLIKGRGKKS